MEAIGAHVGLPDLLKPREPTSPNIYALQHAHASQLLKASVDAKVISKRLGHSPASFTMDVNAHLNARPGRGSGSQD